jgi:plastocyanin
MPRGKSKPQASRQGRTPGWLARAAGVVLSCALTVLCALAVAVGVLAGDTPPTEEPARSTVRPRSSADANTGSLEGTVFLGPKLSSRKMRFHLYADAPEPAAAKRSRSAFEDELQNVVVYLESDDLPKARTARASSASAGSGRAQSSHVVRQENLAFVPHVVPILKGSTVEFPNSDPIFHNVFSLSRAASFDLGRYQKGATKSVRFDEPGMVKVFCHVHSDMSAVIIVLDNPYFATPGVAGRYRIDGIPAGEYRAIGWHERARPVKRTVRIEPGGVTVRDFSIPLAEASEGD